MGPKEFESNKYSNNSFKCCVLEIDFEYSKELRELHIVHPFASGKIGIKKELSIRNTGFYNIPISTVTKLVPNSDKKTFELLLKKRMCFIMATYSFI